MWMEDVLVKRVNRNFQEVRNYKEMKEKIQIVKAEAVFLVVFRIAFPASLFAEMNIDR